VNINDAFPSKYLRAPDLQGTSPTVTVAGVDFEPVGRSREVRPPIVRFVNKTKGLLLNKTNALALAAIAGTPQTDQWVGIKVRLVTTTATFAGESYPVIRVQAAPTRLERVS
jgi:hypothetical protein